MRLFTFLLFLITFSISSFGQKGQFWSEIEKSSVPDAVEQNRTLTPDIYRTLKFDYKGLQTFLSEAPMEVEGRMHSEGLILTLPHPNGDDVDYLMVESPGMMPGISARYPSIKSYYGYAINEKNRRARLVVSTIGIHGVIDGPEGQIYIDPYSTYELEYGQVYYVKDYNPVIPANVSTACGTGMKDFKDVVNGKPSTENFEIAQAKAGGLVVERKYRLAIASTGEWTARFNSTVEDGLAAMNAAVARLNSIFERDLSVRVVLIDDNDKLIHTSAINDPFTNSGQGLELIGQGTSTINSIINVGDYDIGHIYTSTCSDVGGVASLGSVCGDNKGNAVTCWFSSNIDATASGTNAHEMGHQMRGNHTFNWCPTGQDNVDTNANGSTGFEPGSGSTIMSYNGSCNGVQNISGGRLDIYHPGTISEIRTFMTLGNGNNCAQLITSDNNAPDIDLPYDDDFYIPISTPFKLEAIASDENNDALLFSFEQMNTGPQVVLGQPAGNTPTFRVFRPSDKTFRYFPRLNNVVQGVNSIEEVLPTYSRNFMFRALARDYNMAIGGVSWDDVSFESTDEAGPFLVMHPNTSVNLEAGSTQEVTWDVANTDGALVNCQFVNILLSTDGGYNYPITLAEHVENDGAHLIVLPDMLTPDARIKIEAVGNIFYDISNINFSIVAPTDSAYNFSVAPYWYQACLPTQHELNVNTLALQGYDSPVTFSVNGLPSGSVVNYSNQTVLPGEEVTITFDMMNADTTGLVEVEVLGISAAGDSISHLVKFDLYSNNFSQLALTGPAQSAEGVQEAPLFEWDLTPNALNYSLQVASSPSFETSTILYEIDELDGPSHQIPILLGKNKPIYWRVAPNNICGLGDWTDIHVFHTETLTCDVAGDTNLNIIIPTAVSEMEHTYTFLDDGTINDLNISNIDILYSPVTYLELSIVGPNGDEVELMKSACGGESEVNVGFDSEAPTTVPCPPNDGFKYKPIGDLSIFNGQNVKGDWTLKLKTTGSAFDPGRLRAFTIEVCSNVSQNGPQLVNNNVLGVRPNEGQTFEKSFLLSEDQNNTSEELIYTYVEGIEHGELRFNDLPIAVGAQFNQAQINQGKLRYFHNGDNATEDSFFFTVIDGEGGFIGKTEFLIDININNPALGTNDQKLERLKIFPNPSNSTSTVELPFGVSTEGFLTVVDLQGKVVLSQVLSTGTKQQIINTSGLAAGAYFIQWQEGQRLLAVEKLMVQD